VRRSVASLLKGAGSCLRRNSEISNAEPPQHGARRPSRGWTVVLGALAALAIGVPLSLSWTPPSFDHSGGARETVWSQARVPSGSGDPERHVTVSAVLIHDGGAGTALASDGRHLRSADYGRTWSNVTTWVRPSRDLAVRSDGFAVATSDEGFLRISFDSGGSWEEPVDPGTTNPLGRVAFSADGSILVAGGGLVLRGDPSGELWQRTPLPARSYYGVDCWEDACLAVGGGGLVAASGDGGVSWSTRLLEHRGILRSVAFLDAKVAIAVGSDGAILRSEDRGTVWASVQSPTRMHLQDVASSGSGEAIAVGLYGTILRTADEGRTWSPQLSGTRVHLLAVHALPSGRAVAAGWFGTVLVHEP
jgi:photosystem II stability/assembly factor-like uncharacterized protein